MTLNSQLSAIFNFAVQYFKLPVNPCSQVKAMGKKQADEMNFWTLDEFNEALKYVNGIGYRMAFLTLYWTGIREGELLALSPKKILHQEKAIKISHTLKRENGEMVLGDPKTENSVRIVTLPDFLYEELTAYMNGLYGLEPDDPIFYMSKHGLLSEIGRMAEAAGLQRIRVHDLRHSHVALLIELAKTAAAAFPEAEIEIIEKHHNRKLDAPSGTALAIADAVCEVRPNAFTVKGRSGNGKRDRAEIGIHAVRMGNIVGEHEVIVGTQNQTITLKHEAHSRALFAEGALSAARFLADRPAGLYDMKSMISF